MLFALAWQDHAVIGLYLLGMIGLGAWLSRKQTSDVEYFLGGRAMPWFAVGMSVIASLLSSLTYLAEPGEVWNSGVTHVFGKMIAIPFEMIIVWVFCIPFMMRFRFTSAYEYLDHRFGPGSRLLGVALFLTTVIMWMGFVVLASARALATVTEVPLFVIIATVGVVATVYTMLGGLRAVIWTDVIQVLLLVGGGMFTIGFVAYSTGTGLPEWYASAVNRLNTLEGRHEMPWFSFDPRIRATVITVAINMCVWHVCTHTANQMTVQRYYSTRDAKAARRSFITGSVWGVGLNLMLVAVGLAVLYYYYGQGVDPDGGLNPAERKDRDLLFPTFAVHRLPPGVGGGILAALLAAAMSSIDSGVNSIATVLSVEIERWKSKGRMGHQARPNGDRSGPGDPSYESNHVKTGMIITLISGLFITVAAYSLNFLPGKWGIVDSMPRTFNAIVGPLGGLFLVGMFIPWARGPAAVAATFCGLFVSIGIGYYEQLGQLFYRWQWIESPPAASLSFTWVMPCSLAATMLAGALFGALGSTSASRLPGLTWRSRNEPSPLTEPVDE